jgi:hypothetical protein
VNEWTPATEGPFKRVKRCKQTDCTQNLHCFLKDRKRRTPEGTCLSCGAQLINWDRIHRRDIRDVDHTVESLKLEHIRHEFWCTIALTTRAESFARKRGRSGIYREAVRRVQTKLAQPGRIADWGQTPFEDTGNAIHFAQHATATCCRRCIEVWHGITRDEILSVADVEYFAQLILKYVIDRLPDLPEESVGYNG